MQEVVLAPAMATQVTGPAAQAYAPHTSLTGTAGVWIPSVTLVLTPDKLQSFLDLHIYEIKISPSPSSAHCKKKKFLQV